MPKLVGKVSEKLIGLAVQYGIPLSQKTSELIAKHQGRLASIDALKTVFVEEARAASHAKAELIQAAAAASDPIQKQQLLQAISQVDSQLRTVHIGEASIPYIAERLANQDARNTVLGEAPPTDQWIDTFLSYARMRNEPWRQDLFAKLLAIEMVEAGSMAHEVMWAVGNLTEETFNCYACILDLVAWESDKSFLIPDPNSNETLFSSEILGGEIYGRKKYSNLLPLILEHGLLHPYAPVGAGVNRNFKKGEEYQIRYGSKTVKIEWLIDHRFTGFLPTNLGEGLARLYTPNTNALGEKLFVDWVEDLKKNEIIKVLS